MNNPLNPVVPQGQYALIQIDVRTGIVLNLEGKRYIGLGERFLHFETLSAAKDKAREIIQLNPEIECVIQDEQNVQIAAIRDEKHIQSILDLSRISKEGKRGWWKLWKK